MLSIPVKPFLSTLLVLLVCQSSFGYVVNVSSKLVTTDGTVGDTAAATTYLDGLAQDGWTVLIGSPGISYTWTTELVWGPAYTVTIAGAGGSTNPITIYGNGVDYIISCADYAPKLITIKDVTFGISGSGVSKALLEVNGWGLCFRITDCSFLAAASGNFVVQIGPGAGDVVTQTGPYGLIDHCNWNLPATPAYNCVNVSCNGSGYQYGWTLPMTWGTTNSVVVESCSFSQPNSGTGAAAAMESDDCARWCFRYNMVTNFCLSWHGTNSGGRSSTLQVEAYMNTFYENYSTTPPFVFLARGGTSVIWSNTAVLANGVTLGSLAQYWVECASTNWAGEFCPAQLFYPANYPAPQQIGQGSGDGITTLQSSVPSYVWSNSIPAPIYLGLDSGDAPFIVQGRDIFTNSVMPSYSALVFPHPLDTSTNGGGGGGNPTNSFVTTGTVSGLLIKQ